MDSFTAARTKRYRLDAVAEQFFAHRLRDLAHFVERHGAVVAVKVQNRGTARILTRHDWCQADRRAVSEMRLEMGKLKWLANRARPVLAVLPMHVLKKELCERRK